MKNFFAILLIFLITISAVQTIKTTNAEETNQEQYTIYPTQDADIKERKPDRNSGERTQLLVSNKYGHSYDYTANTHIQFDLSTIPTNTDIKTAKLNLYYYSYYDTDPIGREISCYRITEQWDENTITYNTKPTYSSTLTSYATIPPQFGWVTWDVTNDVKDFLTGSKTNHGWVIIDENFWGTYNIPQQRYYSKEGPQKPYLTINGDKTQNNNLPDLTITNLKFQDTTLQNGQPTKIDITVKNIGTKKTDEITTINFYNNNSINPPSIYNHCNRILLTQKLEPDESITLTLENYITVPIYNKNNHNFYAIIDPLNQITEKNENNNHYYTNIPIKENGFSINPDTYKFSTLKSTPHATAEIQAIVETFFKNFLDSDNLALLPTLTAMIWELTDQGHCYGMASTSILYYQNKIDKPINKKVIEMKKTDNGVSQNIITYQARSVSYLSKFLLDQGTKELTEPDEKQTYKTIKKYTSKNKPIMLIYNDHAVVAFDTYDITDTLKHVVIYDNAIPGEAVIAEFNYNDKGIKIKQNTKTIAKSKKYIITEAIPYKTDQTNNYLKIADTMIKQLQNGFIDYLNDGYKVVVTIPDTIYSGFQNLISDGLQQISFWSPVNITIKDTQGNIINNKNTNQIPNAHYQTKNEVKIFYLPLNQSYTITINGTDTGNLSVKHLIPQTNQTINFQTINNINITPETKGNIQITKNATKFNFKLDDKTYTPNLQKNINNNNFPIKYNLSKETKIYNYTNMKLILIPNKQKNSFNFTSYDQCSINITTFNKKNNQQGKISSLKKIQLTNQTTGSLSFSEQQKQFLLKLDNDNDKNYENTYKSNTAGQIQYNQVSNQLIDTNNEEENNKKTKKTSGFELIIIIASISLTMYIKRRKKT